jgi:hypothetical protein
MIQLGTFATFSGAIYSFIEETYNEDNSKYPWIQGCIIKNPFTEEIITDLINNKSLDNQESKIFNSIMDFEYLPVVIRGGYTLDEIKNVSLDNIIIYSCFGNNQEYLIRIGVNLIHI